MTAADTRLKSGANESGNRASVADANRSAAQAIDPRVRDAAIAGVAWLLDLQNRDGGIPTFCRGWTNLPFDRSSPDITAHALRAWMEWWPFLTEELQPRMGKAIWRAARFLARAQREDRTWSPLWFGNQHAAEEENKTYGTSRVLGALLAIADVEDLIWAIHSSAHLDKLISQTGLKKCEWVAPVKEGITALGQLQCPNGGWSREGGDAATSVEETALAVEALAQHLWLQRESRKRRATAKNSPEVAADKTAEAQLLRGIEWLLQRVENGSWTQPAPIGFYFAKLWYHERMYPLVFTVAALEAVARLELGESAANQKATQDAAR